MKRCNVSNNQKGEQHYAGHPHHGLITEFTQSISWVRQIYYLEMGENKIHILLIINSFRCEDIFLNVVIYEYYFYMLMSEVIFKSFICVFAFQPHYISDTYTHTRTQMHQQHTLMGPDARTP